MWSSSILNIFIIVNLILKDLWGRARPNDILELGGSYVFTPWYQISNECNNNCSFVSGDASVGFALIVFYFLTKKEIYIWVSLIFGLSLGLIRILEGGHFLSDIIMAFLIVSSFYFFSYKIYSNNFNA